MLKIRCMDGCLCLALQPDGPDFALLTSQLGLALSPCIRPVITGLQQNLITVTGLVLLFLLFRYSGTVFLFCEVSALCNLLLPQFVLTSLVQQPACAALCNFLLILLSFFKCCFFVFFFSFLFCLFLSEPNLQFRTTSL